jgi:hypothetical protein
MLEAARARVKAGELIAESEFKGKVILPDGTEMPESDRVKHPAFGALERASEQFRALRANNDPRSLAAETILSAMVRAIERGDDEALAEPHRWAARYLRPRHSALLSVVSVPVLDAQGKIGRGIAAAYDALVALVLLALGEEPPNSDDVSDVAEMLAYNFPSIATLAKMPAGVSDEMSRIELIASRIGPQFAALTRSTLERSPDAAADAIAEGLLRREMADSGMSEGEIHQAFTFKRLRAYRTKYPGKKR